MKRITCNLCGNLLQTELTKEHCYFTVKVKSPKCECQITANPFSYAVGSRGYSFCPYCGEDVREGQINIDELL